MPNHTPAYQCPLCHKALLLSQASYRCDTGHQFDCAREGYVNLLPVQHKRSKEPGDSAQMMQARRDFLNAGYYRPLNEAVVSLLKANLKDSSVILDIGCGEGYYTTTMLQAGNDVQVYGLDVSKVAVRYGAKRYKEVNFCVASSQRLPFNDQSLDAVVRIYAPCNDVELARTVKEGGIVITVAPGPRHLYQLKGEVYQQINLHPEHTEMLSGFELIERQQLAYTMDLTHGKGANLLQMTPFAWRATPDVKIKLATLPHFSCETDFTISLYRRTA